MAIYKDQDGNLVKAKKKAVKQRVALGKEVAKMSRSDEAFRAGKIPPHAYGSSKVLRQLRNN